MSYQTMNDSSYTLKKLEDKYSGFSSMFFRLMNSSSYYDDMANDYQKVAIEFSKNDDYFQAGNVYWKACEKLMKVKEENYLLTETVGKAFNMYMKIPLQISRGKTESIDNVPGYNEIVEKCYIYYRGLIDSSVTMGSAKIRMEQNMGEYYRLSQLTDKYIGSLKRLCYILETEGSVQNLFANQKTLVQQFILTEQYNAAFDLLKSMLTAVDYTPSLKYNVDSIAIFFVCCGLLAEPNNANVLISQCSARLPSFDNGGKKRFLDNIVIAFSTKDEELFTNTVRDFDSMIHIDNITVALLTKVKEEINTLGDIDYT